MKKYLLATLCALLLALTACGVESTSADTPPLPETPFRLPENSPEPEDKVYVAINQTAPDCTYAIVTANEVRISPTSDGEEIGRSLERWLCQVMAGCHTTEIHFDEYGTMTQTVESDWLLVNFTVSDIQQSSMGWVRLEDCEPYDGGPATEYDGPFYPAEATRVYSEDGEELWMLNDGESFSVDWAPNELGLVHAYGTYGGWDGWVNESDVLPLAPDPITYFDTWDLDRG